MSAEALAHDATLEPLDETIAEVQAFVSTSRQLAPVGSFGPDELGAALSDTLRRLMDAPEPALAVALAGFALRLREEHLA